MPRDYEWHVVDISVAKPSNFNASFWKFVTPQFDEMFLAAGIFQYYPNYISWKDDRMHVKQEDGSTVVFPKYESADYHKFFVDQNHGACV